MCPQESRRIMSSSANSFITSYTTDPALILNLAAHRKPITSIIFNPKDATSLASASEDKSIMLWKIGNINNVKCYSFKRHEGVVNDIDYLHNGKLIASCSADKTVRLWAPSLQGPTSHFKPNANTLNSVAFSQTGTILAGASNKCCKEYDLKTLRFLRSYVGHNHWVLCSKYAPEFGMIASCADDKTIRIWDSRVQDNVHVFNTGRSSACKITFNPSTTNPVIAAAMRSGSVRIYDLRFNRLLQRYVLHYSPNQQQQAADHAISPIQSQTISGCNCVAWHPNGAYLLTGGVDGRMYIVDTLEGRPVYALEDGEVQGNGDGHIGDGDGFMPGTNGIRAVAFSTDGGLFAAGGKKYIKIWKTNFISPPTLSYSSLIED